MTQFRTIIEKYYEYFLPQRTLLSADAIKRARMILSFVLITVLIFPPYSITHAIMGDIVGAFIIGGLWLLFLLTPFVLKYGGIIPAVHYPLAVFYIMTTYFAFVQGGLDSPTVIPKMASAIGAALLLGMRPALLWLALEFTTFSVMAILHVQEFSFPQTIPPEWYYFDKFSQLAGMLVVVALMFIFSEAERAKAQARLELEIEKTDALLHNIFPARIAELMKNEHSMIAERFEHCSILFADLVGFTTVAAQLDAERVVSFLNTLFSEIDTVARELGIEKVKTIGDAYMAVCGVPEPHQDHAYRSAMLATRILCIVEKVAQEHNLPLKVRIGLHSGNLVAGVIGKYKFSYDMWGDAVNTASRMESGGEEGKIHISEKFAEELFLLPESREKFRLQAREPISIKGKGVMQTYFLVEAS